MIECVVWLNAVVVSDAVPPETVTGEPSAVEPSMNCTDPSALGLTVAVNVTDVPTVTGLAGVAPTDVVVVVTPARSV